MYILPHISYSGKKRVYHTALTSILTSSYIYTFIHPVAHTHVLIHIYIHPPTPFLAYLLVLIPRNSYILIYHTHTQLPTHLLNPPIHIHTYTHLPNPFHTHTHTHTQAINQPINKLNQPPQINQKSFQVIEKTNT